jgi:hypothetical protein
MVFNADFNTTTLNQTETLIDFVSRFLINFFIIEVLDLNSILLILSFIA